MSDTPTPDRPDHPAARILFGWVEAKATPNILFFGVVILSALLVLADLVVHRHEYLTVAERFGFYGFWGFAAFATAVLSGWPLGYLLRRDEDYYGEAETTPDDIKTASAGQRAGEQPE